MADLNADESNVENTGSVTIEAIVKDDLHLGDERVIYGRGNGMCGEIDPDTLEPFAYPIRAKVTEEVADQLVKAEQAKRV